jgi:biotin carboxyl carrier protein
MAVVPLGNGRYLVEGGPVRTLAFAASHPGGTWVFLHGHTYVVPVGGASRRASTGDDRALVAPMPATVLAVHVTTGQRVERDDLLVVLEAMKMELPIRAPRGGVVTAIACEVGDLVQPGVTLLEIEGRTEP